MWPGKHVESIQGNFKKTQNTWKHVEIIQGNFKRIQNNVMVGEKSEQIYIWGIQLSDVLKDFKKVNVAWKTCRKHPGQF